MFLSGKSGQIMLKFSNFTKIMLYARFQNYAFPVKKKAKIMHKKHNYARSGNLT